LHPLDLLYLARACKSLRRYLLNKTAARWFWRVSLQGVNGFPACPKDFHEPSYANLAFYLHCHVS
ncbi:hypothetical protein DFH09DRAFT_844016, partial [Mycena vulgaris]